LPDLNVKQKMALDLGNYVQIWLKSILWLGVTDW